MNKKATQEELQREGPNRTIPGKRFEKLDASRAPFVIPVFFPSVKKKNPRCGLYCEFFSIPSHGEINGMGVHTYVLCV